MGKVSEYLKQLLRKQLDEHGIIVFGFAESSNRAAEELRRAFEEALVAWRKRQEIHHG